MNMRLKRAATLVLAASVALLGARTASANHNRAPWQSIGPAPPAIEAAIAADAASRTVYVASAGDGVLKSTNGGATFEHVNNGLDALTITAMIMEPGNPDVLYASTLSDVYKTTDGGANWHPTYGNPGVVTLAMDPTNPLVLYSGSSPKSRLATQPANLEGLLERLALQLARPKSFLRWINASQGNDLRLITVDEVCYFRSDAKYTRVVTESQESLIRKSVRELATELDPDAFWQVHRSVIVNLAEVAGVQRDFRGRIQLRLKHRPETLPVSQPYSHRFHQM